MEFDLIIKGLVLGFSIAAPVGPIGILCLHGIVSGIGAATADAFYGALAGFGFTFVTSFLVAQQGWLQIFGGLFLCYLGVSTFFSKPAQEAAAARSVGLFQSFGSTLLLTLSNPMTILSFVAVFASVGLGGGVQNPFAVVSFIGGVFCGSALWWLWASAPCAAA
jgi:threonine/homoserine/homoserine lactone efflux protein